MDVRAEKLLKDMHQTKGARFAAHQRLTQLHNMTNYTVSFSSFVLLCVSIFTVMYQGVAYDWYIKYLTFLSVSLSILIIILSLQEGGKNNLLRAEMMHNCAREVLSVHRELSLDTDPAPKMEQYREKYQRIIDRYPYNHEAIDREIYLYDQYQKALRQRRDGEGFSEQQDLEKLAKPENPVYSRFWSIYGVNSIYMLAPLVFALAPFVFGSVWAPPSENAQGSHLPQIIEQNR